MQHRRATAASLFQNGISQNTKCDNLVGVSKSSHILIITRIFKNTRLFVHRKTAQWDFGEWDIK